MTNHTAPITVHQACADAMTAYYGLPAGQRGNADTFISGLIKGLRVEVRPGVVITVASVTNAGFNGMQVGGYTPSGGYAIGFYR